MLQILDFDKGLLTNTYISPGYFCSLPPQRMSIQYVLMIWMCHGKNCYYFSNDSLTWVESQDKCVSMGGQLVIIDSHYEQTILDKKVGAIMSGGEDKFWIGLTDQKEEGKWLWVDDTPLDSNNSFWFASQNGKKEPDNWQGDEERKNPDGEDCARMGEKDGTHDIKSWFDVNCAWSHRRICEKILF
ncbi:C-type lectin domain family 4 member E-like [Oncorhynchus masou masou]|uniref:C-type lectin domain family 4 member E-like n=1 Tax=Oncorhynchus masou masou TaxID=90313 RepID=UPI003182BCCD